MFTAKDFICDCGCGKNLIDIRVVRMANELERKLGTRLHKALHGGTRCEYVNIVLRAHSDSLHLWGKAIDVRAKGVPLKRIAEVAQAVGFTEIAICSNYVHLGIGRK